MNKSDVLAEKCLLQLGYGVQIIPESQTQGKKEADFLITYNKYTAIVEAKLKVDDKEKISDREQALNSNLSYSSDHKLGRDRGLSRITEDATRQLNSSSDKKHDFKIILFLADCINSRVVSEQFIDTIYGRTRVIELEKKTEKDCYFYRNGEFYSKKTILDASIVGYVDNDRFISRLCLNPYSSNYDLLKKSGFCNPFKGDVIDPKELEEKQLAYIPDETIDRKENDFTKCFSLYDPVLQHLANKYKTTQLAMADFNSPEITIRLPQ